MISAICSDLISALAGIAGVKTVGAWAGDVDAILRSPQSLPGVYLVYERSAFASAPASMGTVKVDTAMSFQVLVIVNSLKSASDGALIAWGIIEGVRGKLIGRQVLTHNKLWPVNEELVFSESGLLVYGLNYTLDTRI